MYVKAPMHIKFTYQISASSLNYFLKYEGVQKSKMASRLCACTRTSGKNFNTVEAPNHIYSHTKFQLTNSITS